VTDDPSPHPNDPPAAPLGMRAGVVRVGTQGWNYADWVGGFYPTGTRPPDFLTTYARAFGVVEVDSTFYASPPARTVRGWAERTPPGFTFALKVPQLITHEQRLCGAEDDAAVFFDVVRELGEKLGPLLLQLGPDFGPDEMASLGRFLPLVPADLRLAVEVRHGGWATTEVLNALMSLLRDHGAALALSDGKWFPREMVQELAGRPTADFHYLRWMGPDRSIMRFSQVLVDRSEEMTSWAAALEGLTGRGVDIYGFFNNHFSGHSPDSARQMQRLLGQAPVDPASLDEQTSLF
jgi:uncharacterized protein YecE (DUF72 family)